MEALPLRRLGVTRCEAGVRVPLPARAGGLGGLPDSLARHPATTPCAVATLASPQSDRASECLSSPWPPGSLLPCLPAGPLPRRATARQGLPNPAPGCHEGCPSPLPARSCQRDGGCPRPCSVPKALGSLMRTCGRVDGSVPPQEARLREQSSFLLQGPGGLGHLPPPQRWGRGGQEGQCPLAWVLVSTQPRRLVGGQAVSLPCALSCTEQL